MVAFTIGEVEIIWSWKVGVKRCGGYQKARNARSKRHTRNVVPAGERLPAQKSRNDAEIVRKKQGGGVV
jgi:hypothetical protein